MGIFRTVLLSVAAFLASSTFASVSLQNDKAKVEFDDNGNLISLKNLVDNREYAGGKSLWRIIYQDGLSLEESVDSSEVPAKVSKEGNSIAIEYGGLFPIKIKCELDGDDVRFFAELSNASKDKVLREFQFPMIKSIKFADDDIFYWTHSGGEGFRNIRRWMSGGYSSYMGQDNKAIERYILYPGRASMNCFIIGGDKASLYVANYDPDFGKTLHIGRMHKVGTDADFEYGDIDFGMSKYVFLNAGESIKLPVYVVSPHSGDWRVSAKKYRSWADSWYKHPKLSDDFVNSNGWQRIILRHQYGKVLFPYSQIPETYKAAARAGFHTIRLYGWWKEGMDAGNPEYSEDDTQGGDPELKKQIAEVQKLGGKVNLYFNGQLIDTSTNYFRTIGDRICVKRSDGTNHIERYPFGGDGTALRVFGNKTFVTACPATPEWFEKLKSFADRAIALGADGIYYDQMGHETQPCYDKSHGHPVPCMDIMNYKRKMFAKVCDYIREKKPTMTIGVEWVCDPIAQYVDYVHNCLPNSHITGRDKFGKPYTNYYPIYQYAFPEFKTCDLSILDNRDIVRRCNLFFMRSWRSDIAVYRCRATIDGATKYRDYIKKINALRDRFRPLVLNGVLRYTDMATCSNPQIDYHTYTAGDKMAIIATQSHLDSAIANFYADGYEFESSGGIGNWSATAAGSKVSVVLKKDALIVLVFKKK